ncbi:MAG: VPLPA-CTERM sorting domain-containing protein [Pseudomonadota bacterium]|nr:VPLPA-CTERM sorting domain-containing protein [Pseudomonadota bacterium]
MFRQTFAGLVVASALTLPAAAATITLDSFDFTNYQAVGAPSLGAIPENPATSTQAAADAIGGSRTITAVRTVPSGTTDAFGRQVQAVVTGGSATVSVAAGVQGYVMFDYNATSVDLTDGGTNGWIDLSVISADLAVTYTVTIDGVSATKVGATGSTVSWAFSEFSTVDFTQVGAISLTVTGPASFDTEFDDFLVRGQVGVVPLPASGLMLLAAAGGLALARRRRS